MVVTGETDPLAEGARYLWIGRLKPVRLALRTVALLLLLTGVSIAQQRGVEVRPAGQELFEAVPPNVVTTSFVVTNISPQELEFVSEVQIPEGWRLVTEPFPFRLVPDGSEIRLLGFFVPQTAPAGRYAISYRVRSSRYPAVSDLARIFVVVRPVTELAAHLLEAPQSVIAGDSYTARFSITNQSNTSNRILIRVQSGAGLPARAEPEVLTLAAGQSAETRIVVATDARIKKGFKHFLRLTAQAAGDPDLAGQAACTVDVIARTAGEVDLYHRIASQITLRTLHRRDEREGTGFQGEFSGAGSLDEKGDRQIDFLFRGPDTLADYPTFGELDRYSFAYRSQALDLLCGDQYYHLSRLTEPSLDAMGTGMRASLGQLSLGGYRIKTRKIDPEEEQSALHVDYRFNDRYRIGANLLEKRSEGDSGRIGSMQGRLSPFDDVTIEFEAACGKEGDQHDNGYWLSLDGSCPRGGTYRAEYIYAGPDFPGYYQDRNYFSGSFSLPVIDRLTATVTYRQEENNLDLDLSEESAIRYRYGLLSLVYRFRPRTSIAVETSYRSRQDRLPESPSDCRWLTFKSRVTQSFKAFFFNVSAEGGKVQDRLANRTGHVSVYEGSAYFSPSAGQTYGSYVRYSDQGYFDESDKPSLTTGLNGSWQIGRKTTFKLKAERYDYIGTDSGDRYIFDASLSYPIRGKYRASAHGRHVRYRKDSQQDNETAFLVEFSIPFGLPVGRKKSVGMLRGNVRDQETGRPMADTILRLNGVAAVTDGSGDFVSPGLKPGKYQLDVDGASIGIERVPVQKTPLEVDIHGGAVSSVAIGVTRSASLAGRVVVCESAQAVEIPGKRRFVKGGHSASSRAAETGQNKMSGLGGVLLELGNGTERWRVLSDRNGSFSFQGLRPGKWTFRAQSAHLPVYHYLEKDTFEIELAPGQRQEVRLRVLPKKRAIRMIEEGRTIIEEKKG